MQDLRYPIGLFTYTGLYSPEQRTELVKSILHVPSQYRQAIEGLSKQQLDMRYRDGGWTVRQVVHHVADSHMNGYVRTKLALTEANPTIKPYEEGRWADLGDTFETPLEVSLSLMEALHIRWVNVFQTMQEADYQKTFFHPGSQQQVTLDYQLGNYDWHGRHHLAHITGLKERMGW